MAKLKSNRMLVTKTKVELAVVRPGMLTENGEDSTVRTDEDRLKLLDVLMTQKVKGKSLIEQNGFMNSEFQKSKVSCYSENFMER